MPPTDIPENQRLRSGLPDPVAAALLAAWIIGQICRDRWWLTGLMFYIPSAFLVLLLVARALIHGRRRQWRRAVLFVLMALAPLYFIVCLENRFSPQPNPEVSRSLRAVHWNVCSGHLGLDGVIETLRDLDADLYVLSEAPYPFPEFSGYVSERVGTMQVLSKYPLEQLMNLSPEHGRLHSLEWNTPDAELTLLVADLPASIRYHRHPLLTELMKQLADTQAHLLVGDLNAPRRSLALDELPDGYRHAWDSVGSGWSYTWPSFCPLLAIDHCIHAEVVIPAGYELQTSRFSDHRLQVFDFGVKASGIH